VEETVTFEQPTFDITEISETVKEVSLPLKKKRSLIRRAS